MRKQSRIHSIMLGITLLLMVGSAIILFSGSWLDALPTWQIWFVALSLCWFALVQIVDRIVNIRRLPASASLPGRFVYGAGGGMLALGLLGMAGVFVEYFSTPQPASWSTPTAAWSLIMLGLVSTVIGQRFLTELSGESPRPTTRTEWLKALKAAAISVPILFLIILLWSIWVTVT